MRPPEPKAVEQLRKIKLLYLQCCHTCDHYSQDGQCTHYNMRPPADFAATLEACPAWLPELPF